MNKKEIKVTKNFKYGYITLYEGTIIKDAILNNNKYIGIFDSSNGTYYVEILKTHCEEINN